MPTLRRCGGLRLFRLGFMARRKLMERRLRGEYRLINEISDDGDARVSGQTAACELYICWGVC